MAVVRMRGHRAEGPGIDAILNERRDRGFFFYQVRSTGQAN
jgi:hypothetical protein